MRFLLITVSDTRTPADDVSGRLMARLLRERGYIVNGQSIIPDDRDLIRQTVLKACTDPLLHAVLLSGGTGISPRDNSYEAIQSILDKELPGFGELFRWLSYTEDVGSKAMLSRAIGGVVNGKVVFSLPGAPRAVELAMSRLILPEIQHLLGELHTS